ncbi:hypothetical protein GCM10007857_36440 [Bradyrhizobium iriomotense]|uniref:Uncharacterized protein n=1 Tax=Bradyrhizobium iriomotense TaxID=441950 RepID=A0ABQ6B424_9BRAD|nr:hypothetical protein GCM10007857_36440 [Bradyrhizobium iriomotense]
MHCARAAASVRARSAGFWNEARPQRPTISSERIEAGISGPVPGSASGGGEEDENDGRLMPPPHAPSSSAKAAAAPSLATVRA